MNRFSKDVGFLDKLLPFVFCEYMLVRMMLCCKLLTCSQYSFSLHLQYLFQSATIIVTAVVSNFWLILPAVILIIALVCIQQYYLRTSRDIKRLESIGWYLQALISGSIITSRSTHIVCSSKSCLLSHIHDTSRALLHQSTGARRNITAAVSSLPE